MKTLVSTLLTNDKFWEIMNDSNKGKQLKNELNMLTENELFGYKYWWDYYHCLSYKQSLWAVAYVILGGCSDDGFDYFRYWLITRGKAVFMNAVKDADSLCNEFEKLAKDEYPEWEEVAYLVGKVYEEKFDVDMDDAVYSAMDRIDFQETSLPEITFEWDEDDETSIRNICPNTFDKWWNNDRF